LRVLVVQDSLMPRGGTETVVRQTAAALAELGWTSVAVCRERDPSSLRDNPVYEVPELFRPSGESGLSAFQAIIDRERPDLVHIHKVAAPGVIQFAAAQLPTIVTVHDHSPYCPAGSKVFWRTGAVCTRALGVPCLIHAYTHWCAARHPVRLWRQFTFSTGAIGALRQARQVLTLTNYVREQLLRSGLERERVSVLAPWVEVPPVIAPEQGETVLFAGRLTRDKGLATLLRALALLRMPFKAVIAGDGPLRGACEKLAAELKLDDSVQFRGWLGTADLKAEYARCALLVLPSLWPEPFGLVGPEAMAHGKPAVGFDVGGVREWLVNEVNGLLVPRGDTAALAAAIALLLRSPELRVRLGRAARNHVAERFDRKLILPRLIEIYHRLLN
jgi:glycosyltransferase involved in cell wall biosynthesis